MATPTARYLIIDAYQTSGIRTQGLEPTAKEAATALRYLNYDLIDQLRNDQLWPSHVSSFEFTTQAGVQNYTIGIPQALPAVQPDCAVNMEIVRIEEAQCQIGNVWTPLRQISNTDFFRMNQAQNLSIIPNQFSFNRTRNPYDTISLGNTAPGGYVVRVCVEGAVVNYELDDLIELPSGYYSVLKFGLAELLCMVFGFTETQSIMRAKYTECLARVEAVNSSPPPKLRTNAGTAIYNIGTNRIIFSQGGI